MHTFAVDSAAAKRLKSTGVETGSIRKVSFSFRFVAASSKNSFHISVMQHNSELKLCNLHQFGEAFNGIAG